MAGIEALSNADAYLKMTIRELVAEARKVYETVEGFMMHGSVTGKKKDVDSATTFALLFPEILRRLETMAIEAEENPEMSSEALVEAHRFACGNHALATMGMACDEEPECVVKMRKARDALLARLKAGDEICASIGRGLAPKFKRRRRKKPNE